MGLSCEYDYEPEAGDVCWTWPTVLSPLSTKRARKCCSCGSRISPGKPSLRYDRYKIPDNEIEYRIYGEDNWGSGVPRAPWFHCENCGNLALFLLSPPLNYVFHLDDDMRELAKEHAAMLAENRAGCL